VPDKQTINWYPDALGDIFDQQIKRLKSLGLVTGQEEWIARLRHKATNLLVVKRDKLEVPFVIVLPKNLPELIRTGAAQKWFRVDPDLLARVDKIEVSGQVDKPYLAVIDHVTHTPPPHLSPDWFGWALKEWKVGNGLEAIFFALQTANLDGSNGLIVLGSRFVLYTDKVSHGKDTPPTEIPHYHYLVVHLLDSRASLSSVGDGANTCRWPVLICEQRLALE